MSEIPIKPEHGTAKPRPALSPDSYPAEAIMEDVDSLLTLPDQASIDEYLENRSVAELRRLILATEQAEGEHRARAAATNDLRDQIRDLLSNASNYGGEPTMATAPRI